MKRNWMEQWKNLQRNNSFINLTPFPMLCEKSKALTVKNVVCTAHQYLSTPWV